MTKLKVNVALDDTCALTISDISGFYDSATFPNGFLPESDSSSLTLNNYKLSQGYFINVLLYNKYASTPVISNTSDTLYKVQQVNSTYSLNFTPTVYTLKQDGSYTIKRFFIPSLEFYTANHTNAIYTGVIQFYTDGTDIYKVIDGTPEIIELSILINEDLLSSNSLVSSTAFISTCYINSCYFKILSSILDANQAICSSNDLQNWIQNRDVLYMTLEVIKYLKQQNNISQIQKLIESLNICGGICAKTLGATSSTNCGCNG